MILTSAFNKLTDKHHLPLFNERPEKSIRSTKLQCNIPLNFLLLTYSTLTFYPNSLTLLLSVPERLSPTHCWLESNSSLTSCTQTELTFPRMNCVKSWLRFTRLKRTLFPSSVSEPNTVVVSPLVSVWSTTLLLTPRSSNQLTD